jgi:hypothetical protein
MEIRTRFSMSADGYVTTPDGWPPLVRDPAFISGRSHGFPEFQERCEAMLMGRATFEPALTNDRWRGRTSMCSCWVRTSRPRAHRYRS